MKAIIYTSNTGSTAEYAQLLGKKLNLIGLSIQKMNIHKNKMLWYNTRDCIRDSYERS